MRLTGKLTKNTNNLNGIVSPRVGSGGRVQDVIYDDESVVNEEGIAIIPPYPTIPPIPVKGVTDYNGNNLVNSNDIAVIPLYVKALSMSKADYDLLPLADKMKDIIYFVKSSEGNITLEHSNQGTSYQYSDIPDNSNVYCVVSLNNIVYAGMKYDGVNYTILSQDELNEISVLLNMSMTYATTQTISFSGNTTMLTWRSGDNYDTLYLDKNGNSYGTKCGYYGCVSHLLYKETANKYIYYKNDEWR